MTVKMTVEYNAKDRARLVSALGSLRAMSRQSWQVGQALATLSDEVDSLDSETNQQTQSKQVGHSERELDSLSEAVANLILEVRNIHVQIADIRDSLDDKQPRRKWWFA